MTQREMQTQTTIGALRASFAGAGATTVYLHGGLLDRSMFAPQLGAFAGRRGVALDLPGFGESAPQPGPMTLEGLARSAADALDTLPAPWDLVGLSLGAGVAVEIARLRPAAVRSLCLISAGRAVRRRPDEVQAMKDRLAAEGRAAMARGFAGRMMAPGADPGLARRVEAMALAPSDETVGALYDLLADYPPVLDRAAALPVPLLIIAGALDANVDPDRLRAMASPEPRCAVLIAEDCGHLPNLERPAEVNAALAAFWRSIDGGVTA